jgi:hypothetical protein
MLHSRAHIHSRAARTHTTYRPQRHRFHRFADDDACTRCSDASLPAPRVAADRQVAQLKRRLAETEEALADERRRRERAEAEVARLARCPPADGDGSAGADADEAQGSPSPEAKAASLAAQTLSKRKREQEARLERERLAKERAEKEQGILAQVRSRLMVACRFASGVHAVVYARQCQ